MGRKRAQPGAGSFVGGPPDWAHDAPAKGPLHLLARSCGQNMSCSTLVCVKTCSNRTQPEAVPVRTTSPARPTQAVLTTDRQRGRRPQNADIGLDGSKARPARRRQFCRRTAGLRTMRIPAKGPSRLLARSCGQNMFRHVYIHICICVHVSTRMCVYACMYCMYA